MASPCNNSPDEVIDKIVSAKANADKFDKFVNGTDTQTVQLGSGYPTPTIRNVVRQIKADGEWIKQFIADAPEGDVSLNNVTAFGSITSRTLMERFSDVVNVKDFGAKGDGETDDSDAIQTALDYISPFGAVFFPQNCKFLCEKSIFIKRPMTLWGGYLYFTYGGIVYDQSQDRGGYLFMDEMVCESAGTDENAIGLRLISAYKNRITNCTFLNFANMGIRVDGGNETNIAQCKIRQTDDFRGTGLFFSGSDNLVSDIDIQGYYCGVDSGGTNFFNNVHAWTCSSTKSFYTTEKFTDSTCFRLRNGRCFLSNIYVDGFEHGFTLVSIPPESIDLSLSNIYRISGIGTDDGGVLGLTSDVFYLTGNHDKIEQLRKINIRGLTSKVGDPSHYEHIKFSNYNHSILIPNFYKNNSAACASFINGPVFEVAHPKMLSTEHEDSAYIGFLDTSKKLRGSISLKTADGTDNTQVSIKITNGGSSDDSSFIYANSLNKSGGFLNLGVNPGAIYPIGTTKTINLGKSDAYWNNLYAETSHIGSSDRRFKDDIKEIDDSVLDAWGDISWTQYRFSKAIEQKGLENARIHTGLIAQQIDEVFRSHGIDASDYGVFCYDKWDEKVEEEVVIDKEAVFKNKIVIDKEAVIERKEVILCPSYTDANGVHHDAVTCIEENIIEPEVSHIEKVEIQPEENHVVRNVTPAGDAYAVRYAEALVIEAAYQRRRASRLEARLEQMEARLNELSGNGPAPSDAE